MQGQGICTACGMYLIERLEIIVEDYLERSIKA
jgi:hypothetical protein